MCVKGIWCACVIPGQTAFVVSESPFILYHKMGQTECVKIFLSKMSGSLCGKTYALKYANRKVHAQCTAGFLDRL